MVSEIWKSSISEIESFLKDNLIPYKKDFFLKFETYFKTGGSAKLYLMPIYEECFIKLICFMNEKGYPYKVVGGTANVFFLDEIDYGIIITTKNITCIKIDGDKFEVGCGHSLAEFVRSALVKGYGGLEGLEGIPGTIGGGVVMNAGAYGYCISDHLYSVKCIDACGHVHILKKNDCNFKHRTSLFREVNTYTVSSVVFKLPMVERRESANKIETFHIARHSYQEFAFPSLGSIFSLRQDFYRGLFSLGLSYQVMCYTLKLIYKNPVMKFLQRKKPNNSIFNTLVSCYLGMKDLGYKPSVKSMNILINDGVATSEDLINYISLVRSKLDESVEIENEIVLSPVYRVSDDFKKTLAELTLKGGIQ